MFFHLFYCPLVNKKNTHWKISNCRIAKKKEMLNNKQKKTTQFVGELINILRNTKNVFRECSLP